MKYLRVFCCLLLLLFVLVKCYFFACLKLFCVVYFPWKIYLWKFLRIVIKVYYSGQNLFFLCQKPMSTTSFGSFTNTFFFLKANGLCSFLDYVGDVNLGCQSMWGSLLFACLISTAIWECCSLRRGYLLDSLLWEDLGFVFYLLYIKSHEYIDSNLSDW